MNDLPKILNEVLYAEPWRSWLEALLYAITATILGIGVGPVWMTPLLLLAGLKVADAVWWHRYDAHYMDPPWAEEANDSEELLR